MTHRGERVVGVKLTTDVRTNIMIFPKITQLRMGIRHEHCEGKVRGFGDFWGKGIPYYTVT